MNARTVLFVIVSMCNASDRSVGNRHYGRRSDISSLSMNVTQREVRSLLGCGSLCYNSPACKAFCYSRSAALCHLSHSSVSSHDNDGLGSKCYDTRYCPVSQGYAWYGARCIKRFTDRNNYTDAGDICSLDGGHLYHLKTLQWDLQPVVDLNTDEEASANLWVGADDLEVRGQFRWSDSSPLAEASPVWVPGQPGDAAHRCVTLFHSRNRLHDAACSTLHKFICQIDV